MINNTFPLVDYKLPVWFSLNASQLIAEGKLNSDGSDLRLVDPNGTEQPIQNLTPIFTNGSNTTYLFTAVMGVHSLYYGNPNATFSTIDSLGIEDGTVDYHADCDFKVSSGVIQYWFCKGSGANNRNGFRRIINSSNTSLSTCNSARGCFGMQTMAGVSLFADVFTGEVLINETLYKRIRLTRIESGVQFNITATFFWDSYVVLEQNHNGTPQASDDYMGFFDSDMFTDFETNLHAYQDLPAFTSNEANTFHSNYSYLYHSVNEVAFIYALPNYIDSNLNLYVDTNPDQINNRIDTIPVPNEVIFNYIGRNTTASIDIANWYYSRNLSFSYGFEEEFVAPVEPANVTEQNISLVWNLDQDLPVYDTFCDGQNLVTIRMRGTCVDDQCFDGNQTDPVFCDFGCSNATLLTLGQPGCIESPLMIAVIFFISIFIIIGIVRFST
jgi:hypothetical protein